MHLCLSDTTSHATHLSESLSTCFDHQQTLVSDLCQSTSHSLNSSVFDSIQSSSVHLVPESQEENEGSASNVRVKAPVEVGSNESPHRIACPDRLADAAAGERSSEVHCDETNSSTLSGSSNITADPARPRKGKGLKRPQVLSSRRPR